MRLIVTSGERQVQIETKGVGRKALRRVEETARRLLAETPAPEPAKPFGFTVGSDTNLSAQDDED